VVRGEEQGWSPWRLPRKVIAVPFRNPLYLDLELLANLSDYYGISLPEEKNVTRRTLDEGGRTAGIEKGIVAKGEKSRAEEITETYSVSTRPVRLMNDLIDHIEGSEMVDLDAEPEAAVTNGAVVQVTGDLTPSAANEVGGILARFMPLLMAQVSRGNTDFQPSQAELMQAFMADGDAQHPQLFDIAEESPLEGRSSVLVLDPTGLRGSATLDDLEGEQTVVAHVDRIVRPQQELSLDKYLLPGLPRVVRRSLGKKGLVDMLSGLDQVIGREVGADDLTIRGPALLLRPLAVF
jgi:hypothetical protein